MGTNEPNSTNSSDSCVGKNKIPSKLNYGRYCHIVKRPDFDGYGFNLHSEKIKQGQYIGKVDANSPAEAAGLREGDQIIEVNGVNIGTETHKQVVQRIKAISNEVRLLLIDTSTDSDQNDAKNAENNTVDSKRSNMTNTNSKSHNISTAQFNSQAQPIMQVTDIATTDVPSPSEQKEYITSINMPSMKSQLTYSNNTTLDTPDVGVSPTNDNFTKSNGQTMESLILMTSLTSEKPKTSQQQQDNDNNSQNNNKSALNLNLTAAEMRAKLLAKKKFDPKNESVDLKKKFDIIQKL